MLFSRQVHPGLFSLDIGGGLFRRAGGGPQLLLDLDFREPNQQAFPSSATGVFSGRTASAIWLVDETSGNLVDEVGAAALVPTNSPGQGYTAVGFYGGTDCYSKTCAHITGGSTENFLYGDTTTFDPNANSLAALLVFRNTEGAASAQTLLGKATTGNIGWHLSLGGGTGKPTLTINDGVVGQKTVTSSADARSGEWMAVLAVIDRSTDELRIYDTVATAPAATDISTVGSIAGSVGFALGRGRFSGAASMPAYLAIFEGTEAEGLGQPDLDAFWTHAQQYTTPNLDTYTRASVACPEVGYETGFGARVAKFGSDQFAYGYKSVFSHASKLGALFERASTNLCLYSEDMANASGWAGVNVTPTADAEEAPDGTPLAAKLAATAANGYHWSVAQTVTASALYSMSAYIKRSAAMGSNVTGRLIAWDDTGGAEVSSVAYTATSEWQRIDLRFTTNVGQVASRLMIEIDNNTEEVVVWGAQVEDGYSSSYVPTTTAPATRAVCDAYLTEAVTGDYCNLILGECVTDFALHFDAQVGYIRGLYEFKNASAPTTAIDSHTLYIPAATKRHYDYIYSGVGALSANVVGAATATDNTDHISIRGRWDSTALLPCGKGSDQYVNGGGYTNKYTAGSRALTWSTSGDPVRIAIGSILQGGVRNYADGVIARHQVYDRPISPEIWG